MYFSDKRPGCRQKTRRSITYIPKKKKGDPRNTKWQWECFETMGIRILVKDSSGLEITNSFNSYS